MGWQLRFDIVVLGYVLWTPPFCKLQNCLIVCCLSVLISAVEQDFIMTRRFGLKEFATMVKEGKVKTG
jgi:hypothetical protein